MLSFYFGAILCSPVRGRTVPICKVPVPGEQEIESTLSVCCAMQVFYHDLHSIFCHCHRNEHIMCA